MRYQQKKYFFAILLSCFVLSAFAQKKFKKEITGKLPLKIFSSDPELLQWFSGRYENYHPDSTILKKLTTYSNEMQIVVVLGTWCSDSQREFPALIKVLDSIQFPLSRLKIYGVNRNKSMPRQIISRYKITNVPTIMVFDQDENEKGRIIENVKVNLEADLQEILMK